MGRRKRKALANEPGPDSAITWLEHKRVSKDYRKALLRLYQEFLMWLGTVGLEWNAILQDPTSVDHVLAHYMNYLFSRRSPFYRARLVVLAVQFTHPQIRFHLPRSWNCIASWKAQVTWRPRTPWPWDLLMMFFLRCLSLAKEATNPLTARFWYTIGCLVRLSFFALLRPAEMLGLSPGDIQIISEDDYDPVLVVAIVDPKNQRAEGAGRTQMATVHDLGTVRWMSWLINNWPQDVPLWPYGRAKFYRLFRQVLTDLRFQDLTLTLASGRSGGTTWYYRRGFSIEQLSFMGRWTAVSSLKSYVQEAASYMVWNKIPPAIQLFVRSRLKTYARLLTTPPGRPWNNICS